MLPAFYLLLSAIVDINLLISVQITRRWTRSALEFGNNEFAPLLRFRVLASQTISPQLFDWFKLVFWPEQTWKRVRIKISLATIFCLTSTSFLSHKAWLVHWQHYKHHIRCPCFYNQFSKLDGSLGDMEAYASYASLESRGWSVFFLHLPHNTANTCITSRHWQISTRSCTATELFKSP